MSVNENCANVISIATILKRNIDTTGKSDDEIVEKLCKLTHVRLDREGIKMLDNLDSLGSVTNLYLQQNCITTIENLSCLSSSLRFLTLAGNMISAVGGLLSLQVLKFLDLSDNLIKVLDVNELPVTLVFVSFANNECTSSFTYRDDLMGRLPRLKSIDGDLIMSSSDESSGDDASTESDDDGVIHEDRVEKSSKLQDICSEMLEHSNSRLDEVVAEHRERLKEIEGPRPRTRPEVQDTVLEEFEQEIQSVLHKMIEAERDVIDKFDIAERSPATLSTKSLNHDVVSASSTSSMDLIREVQPQGQDGAQADEPRNKPTYSSVGTCTSRVAKPCSPDSLRERMPSSRANAKKVVPTSPSKPPAKSTKELLRIRNRRKILNASRTPGTLSNRPVQESLVRIPGARPFHKA